MAFYPPSSARSPPPLQHPVPTHPLKVPEPPATPVSSEYQRYVSTPQPPPGEQQQQGGNYGTPNYYGYPSQPGVQQQHSAQRGPTLRGPIQQQGPQAGQQGLGQLGGFNMEGATAQLGLQLGQNAVAAGQEYVTRSFAISSPLLKHHFNVSNAYVLSKIRILLFPWRHKPWTRKVIRSDSASGQNVEHQPPREDINCPDLYIPAMAITTYVLLTAFASGLHSRWDPELLGTAFTKALLVVAFECAFIKLGCYLLGVSSVNGGGGITDLLGWTGYKFVDTIPILLASLQKSRLLYWSTFLYCFCAAGFFMLRSLRPMVIPSAASDSPASMPVPAAQRGRRIGFLFVVAVMQIIYLGVLGRY